MTDQQYGDYEFEIYFDGVEGRTPGCGTPVVVLVSLVRANSGGDVRGHSCRPVRPTNA
jgi:hypothetical protein